MRNRFASWAVITGTERAASRRGRAGEGHPLARGAFQPQQRDKTLGLHPLIMLAVVRWPCVSSSGGRTLFCDSDGDIHAEDGGGGAKKGTPQWQHQRGIPGDGHTN